MEISHTQECMAPLGQIRNCDAILEVMESVLGGFQSDLSSISSEIKTLQEQSLSMSVRLRNRKVCRYVASSTTLSVSLYVS